MLQTITITVRDYTTILKEAYFDGFSDGVDKDTHNPPRDAIDSWKESTTYTVAQRPLQLDLFADV